MNYHNNPLLSVIIPTYKRPALLKRAIHSALKAAPDGDVEVIVVPNGNDDSWKNVAEAEKNDHRIKWFYISRGHACTARNHGLSIACGKYIRFLDDDDILLPEACAQIERMELACAEISSAPLLINSLGGSEMGRVAGLPETSDFFVAALLSVGVGMTEGSVFLRSSIDGRAWRDDLILYDDYLWMLSLAKEKEWNWIKHENAVGEYSQHFLGERLSRVRRSESNLRQLVDSIFDVYRSCLKNNRLSEQRKDAVAAALLSYAHSAFPSCPIYLSHVMHEALLIAPEAMPLHPLFRRNEWLSKNLIMTEWILLPLRYFSQLNKRAYQRSRSFLTK